MPYISNKKSIHAQIIWNVLSFNKSSQQLRPNSSLSTPNVKVTPRNVSFSHIFILAHEKFLKKFHKSASLT